MHLVLLNHGWAYDHGFWTPFVQALNDANPIAPHTQVLAWNQGYFNAPAGWHQWRPAHHGWQPLQGWPEPTPTATLSLIGHSLGFARSVHWLSNPAQCPATWLLDWLHAQGQQGWAHTRLYSLHGFTQFCEPNHGVNRRVLERMLRKLDTHPHQVLTDFWLQCGEPPRQTSAPAQVIHAELLRSDLQFLMDTKLQSPLQSLVQTGLRCRVLASHQDAVVPAGLTTHWVQGLPIEWLDAPHAGPTLHPQRYTNALNLQTFSTPAQ